jgi:hypothetical protein
MNQNNDIKENKKTLIRSRKQFERGDVGTEADILS